MLTPYVLLHNNGTLEVDRVMNSLVPLHLRSMRTRYFKGSVSYYGLLMVMPDIRELLGVTLVDCLVGINVLNRTYAVHARQLALTDDQHNVASYLSLCAQFNKAPWRLERLAITSLQDDVVTLYTNHALIDLAVLTENLGNDPIVASLGEYPIFDNIWRRDWMYSSAQVAAPAVLNELLKVLAKSHTEQEIRSAHVQHLHQIMESHGMVFPIAEHVLEAA